MADFTHTPALHKLATGALNLGSVDLRAKLCMSNTTADTDQDAANLTAITTLDEYDGAGYGELDFAGLTQTQDDPNNRTETHVNAGTFGATVAAGTRQAVGLLYYVRVDGTPGNDYPVGWKDLTPFDGNGGAINFTENAEGIHQLGNA
jgi:hypothetical protein